ncbi:helix-loop-helix DNA-binding domain-containing protein [Panaeolus papilionaceus]|nr:helix-loop-helix DNA-binding domain-containing protein [Panaeolus papilionaceus]
MMPPVVPPLSTSVGGMSAIPGAGSTSPMSPGALSPGAGSGLGAGAAGAAGGGVTGGTGAAPGGGAPADKQSLLANEKRRRRRESHNAVERRRRDNINEKISELATLIPECMLESGTNNNNGSNSPTSALPSSPGGLFDTNGDPLLPSSLKASGDKDAKDKDSKDVKEKEGKEKEDGEGGEGGVVKANKGMILRKSVEYIR